MSIQNVPVSSQTVNADTNATPNTIVYRDNQSGIYGAVVQGNELITTGTFAGTVSSQTASFTAGAATDYLIDCTSGAVTATLPTPSSNAGVTYTFMKTDSGSNHVNFSGTTAGTSSITTQYVRVKAICNGTTWYLA